ncbi:hypothetical protein F4859DRAFT_293417 [Xylaria cf. heliscus]|nr:hypothetical protein F4859DRAFT_293417 [Xylaria cf. heliscus]
MLYRAPTAEPEASLLSRVPITHAHQLSFCTTLPHYYAYTNRLPHLSRSFVCWTWRSPSLSLSRLVSLYCTVLYCLRSALSLTVGAHTATRRATSSHRPSIRDQCTNHTRLLSSVPTLTDLVQTSNNPIQRLTSSCLALISLIHAFHSHFALVNDTFICVKDCTLFVYFLNRKTPLAS